MEMATGLDIIENNCILTVFFVPESVPYFSGPQYTAVSSSVGGAKGPPHRAQNS